MFVMKKFVTVCALVLAFASASAAELSRSVPKGWMEDFGAAKAQAAKEGKMILMAFSGSDWCGWCVKMDKDIYSTSDFVAGASKRFVLVMVDLPQDQDILSPLAKKQNRALAGQFGIRGFPTSIVVDAAGREVTRFTGYQRGGPSAFLKELNEVKAPAAVPDKK